MKIIKRSGKEAGFDRSKIVDAVAKANQEVAESDRLSEAQIEEIAQHIAGINSHFCFFNFYNGN